jgi:hypothetical protein
MLKVIIGVGLVFFVFSQSVQAQTPKPFPICKRAEMIVNGAVSAYQARQRGVSYERQVKDVQFVAGKLVGTLGPAGAKSYGEIETKVLQSLYKNPQYSNMALQQFRDAMNAAFYQGAKCPQPMSMRIPPDAGHRIRHMPATRSAVCRPPIPGHVGRVFRGMSVTPG